jgi:hypothetical protein
MMKRQVRQEVLAIVSPRRFIEVWQTSASVTEVAKKLRMKRGACLVRERRYRKRGIALKELEVGGYYNVNWDELAEYAKELGRQQAASDTASRAVAES